MLASDSRFTVALLREGNMRVLATIVGLLVFCLPIRADEKIDVAKAVDLAKAMSKAFIEEDYDKVIDATHPKLTEILGGREKWLATMKSDVQKIKDMGVKYKTPL